MTVPFKQTTPAGCGSYALANLFNDDRYLNGIAERKHGECVGSLNKKLAAYHTDFFLEIIFASQSQFTKQANRLMDSLMLEILWHILPADQKENYIRPLLFTIKRTEVRFHSILCIHDLRHDRYHIVDSLQPEILTFKTAQELIDHYHIVTVECFNSWELESTVDECSVFLHRDMVNHLLPNNE